MFEDIEKYVKGLTKEDFDKNVDVFIFSAYGGAMLGTCECKSVLDVIKNEERQVNVDYYFEKE